MTLSTANDGSRKIVTEEELRWPHRQCLNASIKAAQMAITVLDLQQVQVPGRAPGYGLHHLWEDNGMDHPQVLHCMSTMPSCWCSWSDLTARGEVSTNPTTRGQEGIALATETRLLGSCCNRLRGERKSWSLWIQAQCRAGWTFHQEHRHWRPSSARMPMPSTCPY